jgi:hypothetical protein
LKLDLLKQCAANCLHDCSLDLVLQVKGIDYRTTLKCFYNSNNLTAREVLSMATSAHVAT